MRRFLERQLEDPERFARLKIICYVVLTLVILAEFLPVLLHSGHPYFWFDGLPAFGSFYGFISCVLIILVSKAIGKTWLMRREEYYDD